jgi:hypothetical protein
MKKALIPAILLLFGSTILGATLLREPIANAARLAQSVVISNGPDQAVPVREQNLDAHGDISVHEQGIANVNVTNGSLSVAQLPPVTGGGSSVRMTSGDRTLDSPAVASALSIGLTSGVIRLFLEYQGEFVAVFNGPASGGNATIDLALSRPITFDSLNCQGALGDACSVSWIGAKP